MTAARLRVLIVEDNKVTAANLAVLLRGQGCAVELAHDPSAIEVARAFKPNVVLLDLNLPQMDGITLAHHLREQNACKESVLVAITGYDDALYRLMAKEAGIDYYLVKPIDVEALEKILQAQRG